MTEQGAIVVVGIDEDQIKGTVFVDPLIGNPADDSMDSRGQGELPICISVASVFASLMER